jgi:hypothetical protein
MAVVLCFICVLETFIANTICIVQIVELFISCILLGDQVIVHGSRASWRMTAWMQLLCIAGNARMRTGEEERTAPGGVNLVYHRPDTIRTHSWILGRHVG